MKRVKISKFRPVSNRILTRLERYDDGIGEDGLVDGKSGMVCPYQEVLGIGENVHNVSVGDVVLLDLSHYVREVYNENGIRSKMGEYSVEKVIDLSNNVIEVDGVECCIFDVYDVIGVIEIEG